MSRGSNRIPPECAVPWCDEFHEENYPLCAGHVRQLPWPLRRNIRFEPRAPDAAQALLAATGLIAVLSGKPHSREEDTAMAAFAER